MTLRTKHNISLRFARAFAAVSVAVVAAASVAACGGSTQFETIQTYEAEERITNATATAAVLIAQGKDPDAGPDIAGGPAATVRAQLAASATAEAAAGGSSGAGSGAGGSGSSQTTIGEGAADDFVPEVPEGPAEEGEAMVIIEQGIFDPQVIKVKVGTTVTWENLNGSASSASALDGQAEQWDTKEIWRSSFDREKCCASHTFMVVGCHVYRSLFSQDTGVGAVCVVE